MSGYLYFDGTGEKTIDDVLGAVEDAGTARHHTEHWGEEMYDEPSCIESINAAAKAAAADVAALRARVAELEAEHCSPAAVNARLKWRNDHARSCEADVVAHYEPRLATLTAERDAARATVERVRAELASWPYNERRERLEAALTPPGDGGAAPKSADVPQHTTVTFHDGGKGLVTRRCGECGGTGRVMDGGKGLTDCPECA